MAGLYIHIPYCKSKCTYCDFYSTPQVETMEQYVHSLLCEAKLRQEEIPHQFTTLYLGGGTPSVMPLELMSQLINGLKSTFDLSHVEEFTIEANPDDVTQEYIAALMQLGVNRVSMGVQSFNDNELQAINRRHSAQQAIDAVHDIKEAGITNVSIDIIYGLPGQTLNSWKHNVKQAIDLDVQHISAYNLSYEPGTRLWVMRERRKVQEVSDEDCIAMHNTLVEMLIDADFEHYEISNFARPGYRSRHNSSYWNFTPYLGLGAAAHSFDGTTRRYNPSSIKEYIDKLSNGNTAYIEEHLELWERYDEEVMVRLRTSEGLNTQLIAKSYGEDVYNKLITKAKFFIEQNRLTLNGNNLILTPSGVMMSDNIIRDLMWD